MKIAVYDVLEKYNQEESCQIALQAAREDFPDGFNFTPDHKGRSTKHAQLEDKTPEHCVGCEWVTVEVKFHLPDEQTICPL